MKNLLILVFILIGQIGFTQIDNYSIVLEPLDIAGLQGIQSFAFGQYEGKWLIVGGRLDGLHRRQPWAAFDVAGNNNQIIVIDPVSQQKWSMPLTSLSTALQEQLSATNANFFQEENTLYVLGGYGYSATAGDHVTYNNLTAIDLSGLVDDIVNGNPITTYFRQIVDPQFAVTGGRLEKIYDTYYLIGGHKFDGRYNPMNNPTFTQAYTNQIRRFKINDDGVNLSVTHLTPHTDEANLHRRDFNVTPQIYPDGEEGLTAFSGVFQINDDLPFLNAVNIDSSGYSVNNNFSQYYNHYHCANIPVYDAVNQEMHTFFFGGIAQFYDNNGVLMQDDNVPFVKTIARVTRDAQGVMAEYKLPIEMPALLGAGSEFISNKEISHYENNVLKLNEMTADSTLVGYIYGGIASTGANIFFGMDNNLSSASSQLFKVYFVNDSPTAIPQINPMSMTTLCLQVSPNPSQGQLNVRFKLVERTDVKLSITDLSGKTVLKQRFKNQPVGDRVLNPLISKLDEMGVYIVTIETAYEWASQKVVLE